MKASEAMKDSLKDSPEAEFHSFKVLNHMLNVTDGTKEKDLDQNAGVSRELTDVMIDFLNRLE